MEAYRSDKRIEVGEVEYILGEPQVWTGKNWVMADQHGRPSWFRRLMERLQIVKPEPTNLDLREHEIL